MHELMVTQNILEIVLRHADQANAAQVSDVFLVIGKLSSVVDDSVQFYWNFVSEGTVAEGAKLHFQRIPTELSCQVCGQIFSPDEDLTCPNCDSSQIRIISGQEFYLDSIGIESESNGIGTVHPG